MLLSAIQATIQPVPFGSIPCSLTTLVLERLSKSNVPLYAMPLIFQLP
jgi:hypothetical protein